MTHLETLTLSFSPNRQASGIRVSQDTPASQIATTLSQAKAVKKRGWQRLIPSFLNKSPQAQNDSEELTSPRAVIILNGGTAKLEPDLEQKIATILQDGLAQVAAEEKITLITGGTEAGIFAWLGQGLGKMGRRAPCIGVCVDTQVAWQPPLQNLSQEDKRSPLEPHHSHFVLVAGTRWGNESDTMYQLAKHLSQNCPTLNIFAGGGQICQKEMQKAIAQGRKMILLEGSGRTTDGVLAALRGEKVEDERLQTIAQQGDIVPFDMAKGAAALRTLIRQLLFK